MARVDEVSGLEPVEVTTEPEPAEKAPEETTATTGGSGATYWLVAIAALLGIVGLVYLFIGVTGTETALGMTIKLADTLLGVGLIAAGCLTAILARIAQAGRQNR